MPEAPKNHALELTWRMSVLLGHCSCSKGDKAAAPDSFLTLGKLLTCLNASVPLIHKERMITLKTASSTSDFLISKNLQPQMTDSWYKLMQHPAGSPSAQLCSYCGATTTVLKNWRNKRFVMPQNNVTERSTRKTHTLHERGHTQHVKV